MKIVHINTYDSGGGAAIAARRHCEAMRIAGFDARMIVASQSNKGVPWISDMGRSGKIKYLFTSRVDLWRQRSSSPFATWSTASAGLDISAHPWLREADIIVLHWINEGMLSVKGVERLLRLGKPVYWYLHDMWPMTGGCHYALGCEKFCSQCGFCPMLFNRQGSHSDSDLSAGTFKKKIRRWSGYDNLHILAPSSWLADCARRSALFRYRPVNVLVNPLNTGLFKPLDKGMARKAFNLPAERKLILFGAASPHSPYKGWQFLQDALGHIDPAEAQCVVFGNSENQKFETGRMALHSVGRLSDPWALMLLYSACDVFVSPSQADNYPNVLVEAMACGLPCVGFNIGGIPEIIRDGSSGVIASEVTGEALAAAIGKALENASELSRNARAQIESTNSYPTIAVAYRELFD